jgi:hypothetical protein
MRCYILPGNHIVRVEMLAEDQDDIAVRALMLLSRQPLAPQFHRVGVYARRQRQEDAVCPPGFHPVTVVLKDRTELSGLF